MRGEGSAAGHKNDGLVGYPFGQAGDPTGAGATAGAARWTTQVTPRGREASPNDAAVLQLILNGIGHIGMRRGNSILKAAMLGRIQFECELVALILICKAGHDDGADRPGY